MKTLKITFKGTTPLIMHSCQCVNPLHPISKEMKKISSKRTKTDEDNEKLSDLEWEAGLYYDETVGIYIPAENVEATIINGAKSFRKGTDIQKYCEVVDFLIPLDYGCDKTKDEIKSDMRFRDVRAVNIKKAKVMKTRPRFNKWQIEFRMIYDESKIDIDTITQAVEYAGSFVGLCDYRPKYGKFVSTIEEID